MDATVIEAQPRETGSKAAREIRNNNRVPCILYGRTVDPKPLQIPISAMNKLIYGRSAPVAEVQMNGESWNCILKDYDLHPLTDRPLHADFQALKEGEKVTITVPVHYSGIPIGQKNGGDTQLIVREVTISVLPENIPSKIEFDITDLAIGDSLHVSDVDVDYEIKMAPTQTLVTVVAPHIETAPTPTAEEEEEEEELTEEEMAEEGEAVDTAEGEEGEAPAEEDEEEVEE